MLFGGCGLLTDATGGEDSFLSELFFSGLGCWWLGWGSGWCGCWGLCRWSGGCRGRRRGGCCHWVWCWEKGCRWSK